MKTLVILTHINFWEQNCGSHLRLKMLIQNLKFKFKLHIIYLKKNTAALKIKFQDLTFISSYPPKEDLHYDSFLELPSPLKQFFDQDLLARVFTAMVTLNPDVVLIEYLQFAYLLDAMPENVKTILDSHDILSLRAKSFANINLKHWIEIDLLSEMSVMDRFDAVIAIQNKEADFLKRNLKHAEVLELGILLDDSLFSPDQYFHIHAHNLLFLGVNNDANLDGIHWFLNHIWPHLKPLDFRLHVVGSISARIPKDPQITCYGQVGNLAQIFKKCDIGINPMRCGGGVKVKQLDFITYGLPSVSTPLGAEGLEDGIDSAFLIGSTPDEFKDQILKLARSYMLRDMLRKECVEFVQRYNLKQEALYQELVSKVKSYCDESDMNLGINKPVPAFQKEI